MQTNTPWAALHLILKLQEGPLGVRPGAQQQPWKEALLTFTKTTKRSEQEGGSGVLARASPHRRPRAGGGMGTGGSQEQALWRSPWWENRDLWEVLGGGV